ncbi:hypothetical protein HNR35_001073 [Borreliella spielmanii]|uniref:Cytosolic protein n=1 Tax=Borreliella spielmanii TaxID=88916 RepID=A0ABR6P7R6_9SPIR|nr:hypothetical protein [Borreliella spielmanii]MBB6032070.1 hypothetical protein [Borreliella spielmanii]
MELFDENYYAKAVANLIGEVKDPIMYKWFLPDQIEDIDLKMDPQKIMQWDKFLNANPTTIANAINTISTIGFSSQMVRINYLKLQYKFGHLKQPAEEFYNSDSYIGDINNNPLPFAQAYMLKSSEIIKLINHFVLTGAVLIQKNGKNQKRLLPNMYGLLNMPDQVKEEVEASNKDKMDKIFEKIEAGLLNLELGNEFSTPMMVIIDPATSLKLVKSYTAAQGVAMSCEKWEDVLIRTIKAINNREDVYIETSNLLKHQILIYPLNPALIKFKPSKYMLPIPNEQVDKDSTTNIAHSYIDFVLGGLLATKKTILQVNIKQC